MYTYATIGKKHNNKDNINIRTKGIEGCDQQYPETTTLEGPVWNILSTMTRRERYTPKQKVNNVWPVKAVFS